jgi:uncharacterized protein DUF4337
VVWDELGRDAEDENRRHHDRLIAVYIGVLAVILAICSMGGGNATKDATLKNIEVTNTWAFFQAKNLRRQAIRLRVDELETLRDTNPSIPDATKSAIETKIANYKSEDQSLTSNEKSGEGLDQLWARAKDLEKQRDLAMAKDPYFDYAEAFLQIAIVLASVAIISGGSLLLFGSGILAALGILLTFNGFTLLVAVPWIG